MDLTIDVEDYKLNIRSTGIIIHNNKLLTHKDMNYDHYALIGGRIQIGEDSETTFKREILEEMGKEVEILGYVGTIENFFEDKSQKYHEIMFIYNAEFINEEDKKIEETIQNIEGENHLKYEWIDLDKIDEYNLLPIAVKEILKKGEYATHKINIGEKKK